MKNNLLMRFLGWFSIAFVALVALWFMLAPLYNNIVFFSANAVFQLDDPVKASLGQGQGKWFAYKVSGNQHIPAFEFDTYGTFFNIVLLLGLMLAAPGLAWTQRAIRSGIAVLSLFVIHTFFVVVQIKAQFINSGLMMPGSAEEAYAFNWLAVLMGTLGEQLLPLLIVGLLTWKTWLSAFKQSAKQAQKIQDAVCDCGSGKKFKHCCGKAKPSASLPEVISSVLKRGSLKSGH